MKQGRSLVEMAQELERQLESKKDYITPSRLLAVEVDQEDEKPDYKINMDGQHLGITELAHDQIASWAGIPAKYYDKM